MTSYNDVFIIRLTISKKTFLGLFWRYSSIIAEKPPTEILKNGADFKGDVIG
jgi:uncharacterized protein Veg